MAFGDDDLNVFFADMGVPVTFGDVCVQGIVDAYDEHLPTGMGVTGTERITMVTVPSAGFAALRNGDLITVDGIAMRVREREPQKDGGLLNIFAVSA